MEDVTLGIILMKTHNSMPGDDSWSTCYLYRYEYAQVVIIDHKRPSFVIELSSPVHLRAGRGPCTSRTQVRLKKKKKNVLFIVHPPGSRLWWAPTPGFRLDTTGRLVGRTMQRSCLLLPGDLAWCACW